MIIIKVKDDNSLPQRHIIYYIKIHIVYIGIGFKFKIPNTRLCKHQAFLVWG